jgi:hypothetical protein
MPDSACKLLSLPDLEHAGSMFAETDWQSIFRQADRLSVVVD